MAAATSYTSVAPRWVLVSVSVAASSLWVIAYAFRSLTVATLALVASGALLTLLLRHAKHPHSPKTAQGAGPPAVQRDTFVAPVSLEPAAVVRALFDNARMLGSAASAHLWLRDMGSQSLRLIVSEGLLVPGPAPVDVDDSLLGKALDSGHVETGEVARVATSADNQSTLVRVAYPIQMRGITGVAAIDFSNRAPSGDEITALGVHMRLALASALGLFSSELRTKEAMVLIDAARDLSRSLDPDTVLQLSLERAMNLSDAATGSIMLLNSETSRLHIEHAKGLPEQIVDSTALAVGEGIAGWVAASGQPVLIEDLPGKKAAAHRHGVHSAVSVPISDDQGLVGVLNVGSRSYPARFTTEHLSALEILGHHAAVAWRNATAVREAGDMYFDTLRTLAVALETKDPYATGGTDRIVDYTTAIAEAMALSDHDVRAIKIAALLHDVGMSLVGPMADSSNRPLSVMEQGLLKMHPRIAADILEQAPALRQVAPIVYHHHERFDGAGYTAGVKGTDIPLGARILSVADAFVAMTSSRPYREAKSTSEGIRELLENAGTQFDPDVVRVFVDILRSDSNRVHHTDA